MSKISELSDGGVIQGGDTLIAVRSGGNVKVTYGGTTTANIDGGTIDGTVIGGTTPAAGSFTTGSFTGDVSFGDNDKAIFGGGSDLKIYHDGSDSYIDDTGTGRLRLRGAADIVLAHPTNGETYATFSANGANTFYYDGLARLATSATGIDVTGTLHVDGFDYSYFSTNVGSATLDNAEQGLAIGWNKSSGGGETVLIANQGAGSVGGMAFATNTSTGSYNERMRIDSSGQVRLSNTTPVWDTTFSSLVTKGGFTGSQSTSYLYSGQNVYYNGGFKYSTSSTATLYEQSFGNHIFYNAPSGTAGNAVSLTPAMRIDASGNLLVGRTTTPPTADAKIAIGGTGNTAVQITKDGVIAGRVMAVTTGLAFGVDGSDGATERMRIDASGHLIVPNGVTLGTAVGTYAAANTLDDYEEGTWTPTVVYSGTSTPTQSVQLGRYTKIGRMVQAQAYISWNENGSTGDITVSGLPFTSLDSFARAIPSIFSFGLTGLTENVSVTGFVNNNNTTITLFLNNNAATSLSATYTDADQDMYITVTYESA
jgi:hypothetical protein